MESYKICSKRWLSLSYQLSRNSCKGTIVQIDENEVSNSCSAHAIMNISLGLRTEHLKGFQTLLALALQTYAFIH